MLEAVNNNLNNPDGEAQGSGNKAKVMSYGSLC